MILLDADVLLLDIRYTSDVRYAVNQQALQRMRTDRHVVGITVQALLETIGILSFNVSPAHIPTLIQQLTNQYGLTVLPDLLAHPGYAGCTVHDLVRQMSHQMALGDAVQAEQIELHASGADCLLTWNAQHFQEKLVIPVLTPQDWLNQQVPSTP